MNGGVVRLGVELRDDYLLICKNSLSEALRSGLYDTKAISVASVEGLIVQSVMEGGDLCLFDGRGRPPGEELAVAVHGEGSSAIIHVGLPRGDGTYFPRAAFKEWATNYLSMCPEANAEVDVACRTTHISPHYSAWT